jgi:nucleotide sugar dehydrogenase
MDKKHAVVVGLGYVGLPLAILAKEKGWKVTGLDVNVEKVEKINKGVLPMEDKALAERLKKYPLSATTDAAVVKDASVIVVAVPTPVTEDNLPDLEPLIAAITSLRPHLSGGQVLIVESTINPGVMDEVVVPLLKQRADLQLDSDEDTENPVYLVHCPERINPGDPKWSVRNIPRVLGGYSAVGSQRAKAFYESVLEAPVMMMGSVHEAEACKILENTFRDINIAFVNEMAKSFAKLDIDIVNVIKGASTKPFAFMAHYPGNGVGGHCISVDPYYMIERGRQAGFDHEFLKLARKINDSMPEYAVSLLEESARERGISSPVVALLGMTYKKNIDDLRESPVLEIHKLLEELGYELRVYDPFVPGKSTVASLQEAVAGADVIMLGTDHAVMVKELMPTYIQEQGIKVVIDGKNALDGDGIADVGITYRGIGRSRYPKK